MFSTQLLKIQEAYRRMNESLNSAIAYMYDGDKYWKEEINDVGTIDQFITWFNTYKKSISDTTNGEGDVPTVYKVIINNKEYSGDEINGREDEMMMDESNYNESVENEAAVEFLQQLVSEFNTRGIDPSNKKELDDALSNEVYWYAKDFKEDVSDVINSLNSAWIWLEKKEYARQDFSSDEYKMYLALGDSIRDISLKGSMSFGK